MSRWRRTTATIRVILAGVPRTTLHDTYDYPVVLQFGDQKSYDGATWHIPSFPGRIPARRLSEIRVEQGPLSVVIDGPEGFRSGPHPTDWVRSHYPRGKDCALLRFDPEHKKMGGVTIIAVEGTLFVDEVSVGGSESPAESA